MKRPRWQMGRLRKQEQVSSSACGLFSCDEAELGAKAGVQMGVTGREELYRLNVLLAVSCRRLSVAYFGVRPRELPSPLRRRLLNKAMLPNSG